MKYEDGSDMIVFVTDKNEINWIYLKAFTETITYNIASEMGAYRSQISSWKEPLATIGKETKSVDPYARLDKISKNLLDFLETTETDNFKNKEEEQALKYTVLLKIENADILAVAEDVLNGLISKLNLEKTPAELCSRLDYIFIDSPHAPSSVLVEDKNYTVIKNLDQIKVAEKERIVYIIDRTDKLENLQNRIDDKSLFKDFKKSDLKECFIPIVTEGNVNTDPESVNKLKINNSGTIVYSPSNKKLIIRKYNIVQLIKLKDR